MKTLTAVHPFEIRFSEVDSMNIVWHGSYMLYFEDAREAFGARYGLEYMTIFGNGYYAPLVEMDFKFKSPLRYESHPEIIITYRPTESAKIVFDYEIRDRETGTVCATGRCRCSWTATTSWCGNRRNSTVTGKRNGKCYEHSRKRHIHGHSAWRRVRMQL